MFYVLYNFEGYRINTFLSHEHDENQWFNCYNQTHYKIMKLKRKTVNFHHETGCSGMVNKTKLFNISYFPKDPLQKSNFLIDIWNMSLTIWFYMVCKSRNVTNNFNFRILKQKTWLETALILRYKSKLQDSVHIQAPYAIKEIPMFSAVQSLIQKFQIRCYWISKDVPFLTSGFREHLYYWVQNPMLSTRLYDPIGANMILH